MTRQATPDSRNHFDLRKDHARFSRRIRQWGQRTLPKWAKWWASHSPKRSTTAPQKPEMVGLFCEKDLRTLPKTGNAICGNTAGAPPGDVCRALRR